MKRYIFFLSLCLLPTAFVFSQPGSLDSSFSQDGSVRVNINGTGGSIAHSIAIQSNGKIIIAGRAFGCCENIFGLVRYNSNGTLDNSFGKKGQVITAFSGFSATASSVLLLTNETIIAGGYSGNGSILVKYKKSGVIDSSFGVNGEVISDFGGGDEGIFSLALQSDGKIIAAGVASGNFAVARYNENGTRDISFGTNGLVTTDIESNTTDGGRGVRIQTDGKIVVAGFTYGTHGIHDAVLVRYKKNGQLDKSFGKGGIVITDLGSVNDYYTSIVIQPNGKINVAGSQGGSFQLNFVLAQYNKNGILDSSFGTNGLTITDFGNTDDKGNSLALQTDGKIVVAGSVGPSHNKFALCRYKIDGKLDSSFGTNGKLTTDFGGNAPDNAYAIAIQPDGKIVAAGNSGDLAAIARYNSDSSNLHFAKNIVTNIKTNKSTTISLSPNPVKDVLYLSGMNTNKKTITIISDNGSVSQHIVTENSSYTINTKQLKAGVYFVKITEGEKTTTLKFLKE